MGLIHIKCVGGLGSKYFHFILSVFMLNNLNSFLAFKYSDSGLNVIYFTVCKLKSELNTFVLQTFGLTLKEVSRLVQLIPK